MKKQSILFLFLFLTGCSATNQYQASAKYDLSVKAWCMQRNKQDDEYCDCFTRVMSERTPDSLKSNVTSADASNVQAMIKVLDESKQELAVCEAKRTISTPLEQIDVPEKAKKLVKRFGDDILSPSNRRSSASTKAVGYKFSMYDGKSSVNPDNYTALSRYEHGIPYFSTYYNGKLEKQDLYKVIQGIKHMRYQGYEPDQKSICLVQIGECVYKTPSGLSKKMKTIFKEGVWISDEPGFLGTRRTVFRIFTADGLPLYEKILFQNGSQMERVRYEHK
ncbi:hypothetical protein PRUB_a4545 [Pseudoalteromonas rubra]|uniref:Uncharacterized protein n=1 Tax=Pseudoalteromonas rubra TaxID=43658 RepID=A0A8T0CBA6_9GAMM|nr:hypothetical protein [Pseudoalteromonas rubra]KAF7787342.1 hypothetical protein PRUB_a4545 [Pseudoalteromonas rubra]